MCFMKTTLFIILFSQTLFAQNLEVNNSDQPINISGTVAPLSQADKMKIMRKKLEKQNELMVKKQIEQIRLQQEVQLNAQLQAILEAQLKKVQSI